MILKFSYETRIDFSVPVRRHYYSMKCVPRNTARQNIQSLNITILPENKTVSDSDVFGNIISYGYIAEPHNSFSVSVNGVAETGLALYEERGGETDMFLAQSALTRPGGEITAFYKRVCAAAPKKPYNRALYFMKELYQTVSYIPNVTDVNTSAERSMTKRRGVCQDFAQILISLLRMDGIPARYVAGMMIGEGETHAWVEAYLNGYWYGFDPTNNLLADDYYIKISHGRDSRDCKVSRGVFYGGASQTQAVGVNVNEQ